MDVLTTSERRVAVLAALLAAAIGSLPVVAQVKTNVPDVVAGAPPAIVERITIHGTAADPKATNSIDAAQAVAPVTSKVSGVRPDFTYKVPAHGTIVLTLEAH